MEREHKIRIVLADDHTLFRQGLKSLLSLEEDLEVVEEAADGFSTVACTERLNPDLLLLDLSMPRMDGLEAIHEIKSRAPKTKILILTAHKAEEFVSETLRHGADGYVVKDADHSELLFAIRSVLSGKRYLSPDISHSVIRGYLTGAPAAEDGSSSSVLTFREREIVRLIALGRRSKEIALELFISEKTVAKHRANIMRKLDLHSASALTSYAIENGLISGSGRGKPKGL